MSHFAELDNNNIVLRLCVGDDTMPNEGHEWFVENLGGTWIKTSYNATINGFRKHYAGIGYTYDEGRDAFILQKPFESWVLDEDTCNWKPPVDYPIFDEADPKYYTWDEATISWVEI